MIHSVEIDLGGGRMLTLETGKMAKQANGAIVARLGDTVVLVSACSNAEPKENPAFFPLTVDYREATYSAGRFPGGFIKREGRPTEKEVLTCRYIDRPIRPLFPEGYMNDTQIAAMVLSADPENDPGPVAIAAAGAALAISDIPFHHLLSAVRVGLLDGKMVANPTYSQSRDAGLNILVAGTPAGLTMVEAGANQVSEADVLKCIEFGHEMIQKISAGIADLVTKAGKTKRAYTTPAINEAMYKKLETALRADLADAMNTEKYEKLESYAKVDAVKKQVKTLFPEEEHKEAKALYDRLKENIFRDDMLVKRRRPDGRKFDEIRKITIETTVLPRPHGSVLFTRGETQALVTATLGTKDDAQRIELLDAGAVQEKRFMLFYNFPPFSVGEVGFMRGPGRREIGHGALAERSLIPVLPTEQEFPYTLKIVSEILESNGSSSMASVCGGSLAMMDAGVPLKAAVAGVAMGLVAEGDKYAILTDIAGAEDHYGDMDFKVAGTRKGITALQMDIKTPSVTTAIMKEALEQAKAGRMFLLDKMDETLPSHRPELSKTAPRITTIQIPVDKIREVIGKGGAVIRSITEETGAKIDISDDGTVSIFAADGEAGARALQRVQDICATAEIGKTYLGKVVRIVDFGAFVEIFPGTDGLLHISEIAENRVKQVTDELQEGDQIQVKCIGMEGNKIKLSRKAVLKELRDQMAAKKAKGEGGGE
jgi:polyribonucleotide nucleotidyltransferase